MKIVESAWNTPHRCGVPDWRVSWRSAISTHARISSLRFKNRFNNFSTVFFSVPHSRCLMLDTCSTSFEAEVSRKGASSCKNTQIMLHDVTRLSEQTKAQFIFWETGHTTYAWAKDTCLALDDLRVVDKSSEKTHCGCWNLPRHGTQGSKRETLREIVVTNFKKHCCYLR